MRITKNLIQGFSQLFFPHVCAGCGSDLLTEKQFLCLRCLHELPLTHFHLYADNPVEKIFWGRVPIVAAYAHFYFSRHSALQQVMHQLKYNGQREIGEHFGRMMGKGMSHSGRFDTVDALVPLPLYASREKKRGYNQAAVICEGIAETMKLPLLTNAILRTHATETQTHKNRINRWQNMMDKFQLSRRDLLENKHVLLVDDIITTGATLDACANELLQAPGVKVSIAALAWTEASA